MKAAAYLRVSTDEQTVENQRADVLALCEARGWAPVWFTDEALSGKTTDRPAYLEMMKAARQGKIKAVVVWKFDRLGRTVRQLVTDLDDFSAWGVALVSCRDNVDTTTPMGRAMFGIIAVLAQMERDSISERTRAAYGRKKARAENLGQKVAWGRREVPVNPEAVALAAAGVKAAAIARELGISRRQAGKAVEAARKGEGRDGGAGSPVGGESPKTVDSVQGLDQGGGP